MNQMIKILLLSILSLKVSAQKYEVYDNHYDISPSIIIEKEENSSILSVYKTNYGIPEITPILIIEPTKENTFEIYETTNGIKDILPIKTIKPKDYDFLNK